MEPNIEYQENIKNDDVIKNKINIKISRISETENIVGSIDVVFIENVVNAHGKEYYRLYIRPALSRKEGQIDGTVNFLKSNTFFNFTFDDYNGKIPLKTIDGKDKFQLAKDATVIYKDNLIEQKDWDFICIPIPVSLFRKGEINKINFSGVIATNTTLFTNGYTTAEGTIEIQSQTSVVTTKVGDLYRFEIKDFASAFVNYGKYPKAIHNVGGLAGTRVIYFRDKTKFRVDSFSPKYEIRYGFTKADTNRLGLGLGMDKIFSLIEAEVTENTTLYMDVKFMMKDGDVISDASKYYAKWKPKVMVKFDNEHYIVKLKNGTRYDAVNNIIVDSLDNNDILLHPEIKTHLTPILKLYICGLVMDVNYDIDINDGYQKSVNYDEISLDFKLMSEIGFDQSMDYPENLESNSYLESYMDAHEVLKKG